MRMIKEGEEAKIIYSRELADMRLICLVGQRGVITKCVISGRMPGAYIQIEVGKNKGEEWYIPLKSIQTASDVNKIRNMAILRSTKL